MRHLPRCSRLVAALLVALVFLPALGLGTSASATASTLYAGATASGTGNCSSAADACTLTTALNVVQAGDTIVLITPGVEGELDTYYSGGFTLATAGTSATSPVTIEGAAGIANPILDGGGSAAVLTITTAAYVTLHSLTFQNGKATAGAGIDNEAGGTLTISSSTFSDNIADDNGEGDGGAIDSADGASAGSGRITVSDSTFSDNTALYGGGAIDSGDNGGLGSVVVTGSTFSGNTSTYSSGGAIDSGDNNGTATLTVSDSTFWGNSAFLDGGAIDNGDDGGTGTARINDSTFSGDTSTYGDGGAIDSGDEKGSGTLTVTSSTFATDTAIVSGDAIDAADNSGTGSTTIAADVFGSACAKNVGSWIDAGYNLDTNGSCIGNGLGDETDPSLASQLSTLAFNGGATETIALLPGNPALGLIPNPSTGLCPVTADERGEPSPPGAACDAGAVQLSGQTITFATVAPVGARAGGSSYAPVARSSSGLAVTLSLDPSSTGCTLTNGVVVPTALGTCVIDANQPGDANFAAAATLEQSFPVGAENAAPPGGVAAGDLGSPSSAVTSTGAPTMFTAIVGGATVNVVVPKGALPSGSTISLYPVIHSGPLARHVPSGRAYLFGVALSWQAPNGAAPQATAAITLTITDKAILAADAIYEVRSSGVVSGGTTAAGIATVLFTNDGSFLIAALPRLSLASSAVALSGGGVAVRLACARPVVCRGTARLNVARGKASPGKAAPQLEVASGSFALGAGASATVTLGLTSAGRALLKARNAKKSFAMGLVTLPTGGLRGVARVVLG